MNVAITAGGWSAFLQPAAEAFVRGFANGAANSRERGTVSTSVQLSVEASKALVDNETLGVMISIFGDDQAPPRAVQNLVAQRLTQQTYEFLGRAFPGRHAEEALTEALARLCPDSHRHCARVGELAARFARELDLLPEDEQDELERAASLKESGILALTLAGMSPEERDELAETVLSGGEFHDIGKLAIPDEILNKPGRLTESEFELVKLHPLIGETMLTPLEPPELILASVRGHHERWDGAGYPDGLAGLDIPLEARIISIVDSFDAMTAPRPYRRPISYQEAAQEILACAGKQFDPELAKIFAAVVMAEA